MHSTLTPRSFPKDKQPHYKENHLSESVTGYAGNGKKFEERKRNKTTKHKGTQRKKGKPAPKVPAGPKSIVPANLYVSDCCGALGKKTPLVWSPKDKEENKFSENHKGKFRCTACNQRSTFSRRKNSEGESIDL